MECPPGMKEGTKDKVVLITPMYLWLGSSSQTIL
jgi:hypothetical protein